MAVIDDLLGYDNARRFSFASAQGGSIPAGLFTTSSSVNLGFFPSVKLVFIKKVIWHMLMVDSVTGALTDPQIRDQRLVVSLDPQSLITTSAVNPPTAQFYGVQGENYYDSFNFDASLGSFAPLFVWDSYIKTAQANPVTVQVRYYIEGLYTFK